MSNINQDIITILNNNNNNRLPANRIIDLGQNLRQHTISAVEKRNQEIDRASIQNRIKNFEDIIEEFIFDKDNILTKSTIESTFQEIIEQFEQNENSNIPSKLINFAIAFQENLIEQLELLNSPEEYITEADKVSIFYQCVSDAYTVLNNY